MNIEDILHAVLGKSSANKNPKMATPSMDVINRLMGSTEEPMSERTPIGGSSTQLPQSSLTKLMNGNDATSGNISSDPGSFTPDSTPPPASAVAPPPTSALMTGASGALGGLASGVKGAVGKPAPTIDPVAISANPMAKELAGGSALRQLYDGGTVAPGETVSIGERGPEILHVDKDGKAVVIPDTSVHSAQEPTRIEPHSGVVSAPPTDLQTTPQQVITPVTPIETTAPVPTNQDVQNQPMAAAPITPVDTTAPTVNNQQPQSRPLQMQVQAPADNEPPVNQLYQRPDGGTVNIATNNAPVQSEEDYLRGKMADAQSYRPTNKWAEAGFGALQGLQKGVQQAVYGTRDNSPIVTLDQLRQQREAAKYAPRLAQIQTDKANAEAQAMKAAQMAKVKAETDDIPLKRAYDMLYKQGMIDNRTYQLGIQDEKAKDAERTNFFKTHKAFDPANATDADKNSLARFGETPESMGKYDRTTPRHITVNGSAFDWDANANGGTGSWKDSGLSDPSKRSVAYTAKNPETGETETFETTSEKAAGLWNNLARQGYQDVQSTKINNAKINAAKDRQNSSQQFSAGQQQIRNQMQLAIKQYDTAVAAGKAAEAEAAKQRLAEFYTQLSKTP